MTTSHRNRMKGEGSALPMRSMAPSTPPDFFSRGPLFAKCTKSFLLRPPGGRGTFLRVSTAPECAYLLLVPLLRYDEDRYKAAYRKEPVFHDKRFWRKTLSLPHAHLHDRHLQRGRYGGRDDDGLGRHLRRGHGGPQPGGRPQDGGQPESPQRLHAGGARGGYPGGVGLSGHCQRQQRWPTSSPAPACTPSRAAGWTPPSSPNIP